MNIADFEKIQNDHPILKITSYAIRSDFLVQHLKVVANTFRLHHSSPTSMLPKFSEKEGLLQVVNTDKSCVM